MAEERYPLGAPVPLETTVVDPVTGAAVEPATLTLTLELPGGILVDVPLPAADPARPGYRETTYAAPTDGVFAYRFEATDPAFVDEGAFVVEPTFLGTVTPTPEAVHAVIPTRNAGRPFDAASQPSRAQVAELAAQVANTITAELPRMTPAQRLIARWAATLGTASYVEATFYPEQQSAGAGMGGILWARYQTELTNLRELVNGGGVGSSDLPWSGTVSLHGSRR